MRRFIIAALLLTVSASLSAQTRRIRTEHDQPTAAVQAALADPQRPTADRDRDAARKPADILALAGITPGKKIADFIMGSGYWTRILAGVVGPKGKVYAYQPAEFIQYRAAYGSEQYAASRGHANVVASRESLGAFAFSEPLDAIVTVDNWHDLHLKAFPPDLGAATARRLYAALKPGGTLLAVDHAGKAGGKPFAAADGLHRGDGPATRKEIEAAGFRFAGESPLYADPADPHTASVFDPEIRGRTDQFIYRFVKPG